MGLCVSLVTGIPANAQFFGNWGNGGWGGWGRPQPQQRNQRQFNPFGNFFPRAPAPAVREREMPADYSRAPSPQKKPDPAAANPILVVGDSMSDWLAYGLEDALADRPEFAVLRRNHAASGLIRYDPRRDIEWPQAIKEMIAADKPKFIVMMIGLNDRQQIRERAPTANPPANTPGHPAGAANPSRAEPQPVDPELQAQQSADRQNAEEQQDAELPPQPAGGAQRSAAPTPGTFEFHTDHWEAAYVRRIDAAVAAFKSAHVPIFWVGLPAQRNTRASSDSAYLNELYRQEAEKAGITYVDIWDGFVDEGGRYSLQGPDFEGQIRRLRSGDGIYFTKAGAQKLAHYVEREILRVMVNRAAPVALPLEPAPAAAPGTRQGGASGRPVAGPVVPLTVSSGSGDELLGGGRGDRANASDPVATRVLVRGEALSAPMGRADNFNWPRPSGAPAPAPENAAAPTEQPVPPAPPVARSQPPAASQPKGQPRTAAPASAGAAASPDAQNAETAPAPARRVFRPRANPAPTSPLDGILRPPAPIKPSAGLPSFVR
jgi:hypothetical protein